jgi:hypothetical protein
MIGESQSRKTFTINVIAAARPFDDSEWLNLCINLQIDSRIHAPANAKTN